MKWGRGDIGRAATIAIAERSVKRRFFGCSNHAMFLVPVARANTVAARPHPPFIPLTTLSTQMTGWRSVPANRFPKMTGVDCRPPAILGLNNLDSPRFIVACAFINLGKTAVKSCPP